MANKAQTTKKTAYIKSRKERNPMDSWIGEERNHLAWRRTR